MAKYAVNPAAVEHARQLIRSRHKDIELAAHNLLQELDAATGLTPG